jgi:hypothetical protein
MNGYPENKSRAISVHLANMKRVRGARPRRDFRCTAFPNLGRFTEIGKVWRSRQELSP